MGRDRQHRRHLARPPQADPRLLPQPLTRPDARRRRTLDQPLAASRLRAELLECRLDLEWARLGPPDLEFATISGDDADIHARGVSGAVSASELPLLTWLRAGYLELVARPYLTERVWLYDICFRIRQICAWGRLDPRSLQDLTDLTMRPRVRFP